MCDLGHRSQNLNTSRLYVGRPFLAWSYNLEYLLWPWCWWTY